MTIGDPLVIQTMDDDGEWTDYLRMHALDVNKRKSSESASGGGEQVTEAVGFRVRWCKELQAVEFDKPSYSILWRGNRFDIRGYDDYKYQHRRVDIEAVSHG